MDNIDSINMPRSQSPVMLEMRQMAAMAGSGLEFGTIQPAATNSPFFPVEKGANNLSFSQVLNGAIKSVDQLQHVASEKQTAMGMGISDDLTGTMLASQKASVAFSAMVQVRNKLTSALDDVMNTAL